MRWSGLVALMGDKRGYTRFCLGNPGEREHLEDLGVDGELMLKRIFKKWDGGMDWIDLAQDRDRWRAFVKAVRNLLVP
jgi:hypothetical protein